MCVASLHESFNANWMSPVVLRAVLWSQLQVWMFECQCEYLKNIFGSLYCIFEIIFAYLGESLLRLMSNHFLHSVYDKVSKSNHLYLTAWWLWLGECVILRHWIAALRMETSQHVWIITNCWVPPPPARGASPPARGRVSRWRQLSRRWLGTFHIWPWSPAPSPAVCYEERWSELETNAIRRFTKIFTITEKAPTNVITHKGWLA